MIKKIFQNKEVFLAIFLVLVFSFASVAPLFSSYYFPIHDDTQPTRIYQMTKALTFGQFPVRWVPDLGYGFGYPLFNFYAPLPYYVGALFNILGADVIWSAKYVMALAIFLSAVTMYLLAREIAGNFAGIFSSILYVYAPYHGANLYVRGAVGELWAYAFLPLVFLGIVKIFKSDGKKAKSKRCIFPLIIIAFGSSLVYLSHNILGMVTGYLLALFISGYFAFCFFAKKAFYKAILIFTGILLGLGISSFFLLPAVFEMNFTNVSELTSGGSNFRLHFVYLDQLWDSPWGFAGSAPGREDGMSFKIGKLHLMFLLLSSGLMFLRFKDKKKKKLPFKIFWAMFGFLILSCYLTLSYSQWLWEILPGFSFIQYPWRFLNFIIFSLSFLSSFILYSRRKILTLTLLFVFAGTVILVNKKYFKPQKYIEREEKDYISKEALFHVSSISDEYMPEGFALTVEDKSVRLPVLSADRNRSVTKVKENPTDKEYVIEEKVGRRTTLNLAYFPGWTVSINGQRVDVDNYHGLINFYLPKGTKRVRINLQNTKVRALGNTISLFCLFLIVYLSLKKGHFLKKDIEKKANDK